MRNVKSCEQKEKKVPAYIFKNRKECRAKLDEIQSKLSELEAAVDSTNKKLLNSELLPTIMNFNRLQHQNLVELGNVNAITTWLGLNELNDLIGQRDDEMVVDFDHEDVLDVDSNIEDEFEIEGDEDEILEIENMRLIDGDLDDHELDHDRYGPRRPIPTENCFPNIDLETTDGFQLQRHQKKIQKNRIKMELKKCEQMKEAEAKTVSDIWNLSPQQKWNLYRFWRCLFVRQIEKYIRDQRKEYSNEWVRFVSLRNQEDLEIVRGHSIIGMTTTGAAKYHHIIDGIKPRIISMLMYFYYRTSFE